MDGLKPEKGFAQEYWDRARVLLLDGALFVTILAVLLISFLFLKAMGAAGYDQSKIKIIETVHFYTYLLLQIILGFDLVIKFFTAFMGKKDK